MKIYAFVSLVVILRQLAVGENVAFTIAINDGVKFEVVSQIVAESPISTTADVTPMKTHEGKSYFKCNIRFSREPSKKELNGLRLSILPKNYLSDPMGMGTVYSEKLWRDLKGGLWKVGLMHAKVSIPLKYKPHERILYSTKSDDGYSSTYETHTDDEGKCNLQWEGGLGISQIKVIPFKDYVKAMNEKTDPMWKTWQFSPSSDGKDGVLSSLGDR